MRNNGLNYLRMFNYFVFSRLDLFRWNHYPKRYAQKEKEMNNINLLLLQLTPLMLFYNLLRFIIGMAKGVTK